jgi:tryptophan halogenase
MKVFILGGGTAGWLSALLLNKRYPNVKIELLESEEIGVLGAGESTLFAFKAALRELDIDELDFIRNTKSTFKMGSRYDGWNGDSDYHYSTTHPWHSSINPEAYGGNHFEYYTYLFANNIDTKTRGMAKIALAEKSPYILRNDKLEKINDCTFHINARLTAQYFRKIAEEKGIVRYEGKAVKINGNPIVESIEDDKGRKHTFDFVFDCSGFARLIIGKHFQTRWLDYSDSFFLDSAIPFFIDNVGQEIPAYTRSTAMDYGWRFTIPTQERYGSGYIFDSTLIDVEDAKKELISKVGHDVEILKHIKFKAGLYEKLWQGNCIAFCLSAGFLEPMTASNISSLIQQFNYFGQNLFTKDESIKNTFNKQTIEMFDTFSRWIYLHYSGKGKQTEFWQKVKRKETAPKDFHKILDEALIKNNFDINMVQQYFTIPADKIIAVLQAYDLYKKQAQEKCLELNLNEKYTKIDNEIVKNTEILLKHSIGHREFLDNYL